MIKINDISTKLKFPVIDFKFQNSGNATAFLWQFIVSIKKIELNITPSLTFEYAVVPKDNKEQMSFREESVGDLEIFVTNNGYGDALNCDIEICHSAIERYFLPEERKFNGKIISGEKKSILKLSGNKLAQINGKLEIGEIFAKTNCIDINNLIHKFSNKVLNDYGHWNRLSLTSNGFLFEYGFYKFSARGPSEIYCVIIDAEKSVHQRVYKISREIKSGDIDRFHIMIGCTKSAKLDLDFKFIIDQNQNINSDTFEVNIWNPMNKDSYDDYIDGDVLREKIENFGKKKNEDDWDYRRLKWKLESLEQDSSFPFYNPDKENEKYW